MKIIIPTKILRAHQLITDKKGGDLSHGGIFISREQIISTNGKMVMTSPNNYNGQMRAEYLVSIDRIPTGNGVSFCVIDTDTNIAYFLDRFVTQKMLTEIDLTKEFKHLTGARVLPYKFPDVRPVMLFSAGRISTVKLSAFVMSKLSAVAAAIGSKTGCVELSFQNKSHDTIAALIQQGATAITLYIKPMK